MTITIWGIALIDEKRKGEWVKCYVFDDNQKELALEVARQRYDLYPLQVTDDSLDTSKRLTRSNPYIIKTFVYT